MPYGFANLVQGGRQEIHCGVAVPRFQARGGEHERHSLCTYPAACPPPSKVVGARLCGRRAGICVARSRADLGEGRHSLREHGRREENASKNRDTYMGRQSMPGQQARRLKYDIASDEKSKKIRPTVRAIRAQVQRMGVTGYAISGLYPNFTPNKSSLCWCLLQLYIERVATLYVERIVTFLVFITVLGNFPTGVDERLVWLWIARENLHDRFARALLTSSIIRLLLRAAFGA